MFTSPSPSQHEQPHQQRVPYISRETLELSTEIILENSCAGMSKKPKPIPVDQIAETELGLRIDYQFLSPDESLLSLMIFNKRTVNVYWGAGLSIQKRLLAERGDLLIDLSLKREGAEQNFKCRFAVAHELGHWFLHQCLHSPQVIPYHTFSSTEHNLLEWQADYFASGLLMPRAAVNRMFEDWLYRHKLSHSYLRSLQNLQGQKNQNSSQILLKLADSVSDTFQVSPKAATMRLYQLKLL